LQRKFIDFSPELHFAQDCICIRRAVKWYENGTSHQATLDWDELQNFVYERMQGISIDTFWLLPGRAHFI
jgi:hypothetical protein